MSTGESPSYTAHARASAGIIARCTIITLSDTRDETTDISGKKIRELLSASRHQVIESIIIKDESSALTEILSSWLDRRDIDVVLTNGGTGIAKRDVTVDALEKMLERRIEGFGELFRVLSWQQIGSGAMLSRAIGGIAKRKLIFAMPGSPAAVELAMSQLILPELGHLLHELRK